MKSSAKITAISSSNQAQLIQEIKSNNSKTVLLLLANYSLSKEDFLKFSQNGYIQTAEMKSLLLQSLLLSAVTSHNVDTFHFAINEGAQVNDVSFYDYTAMHVAVEMGYVDLMDELFKLKANCEVQHSKGFRPLHLAVAYGHVDAIKCLLEHKADINATDKGEWSPLHYAATQIKSDAAKILVENDANLFALSRAGELPAELPCFSELRQFLLDQTFLSAVKINRKEIAVQMLKKGANVNVKDANGDTALHYAIKKTFVDMTYLLLDYGADVLLKDKENIDAGAYAKTQEMFRLCLKAKLIAQLKNNLYKNELVEKEDHSVLSWFFKSSSSEKIRVTNLMLNLIEQDQLYRISELDRFDKIFMQDEELNELKEKIKELAEPIKPFGSIRLRESLI